MHAARLHSALHAFALEASTTLLAAVAAGEEVPFEVVEAGAQGSRPGLFCYQPRDGEFVEAHWRVLLTLPTACEAQAALAGLDGLSGYLDTYAEDHRAGVPRPQEALRCFTHRVFDCAQGDFGLRPQSFEPAHRELMAATEADRGELAVLALLRGLGCESAEVELAEGALLVAFERLEVRPPDPAWREADGPATVVALVPGAGEDAMREALGRLCDLQTALRLYGPGIAFAPLAWIRGPRAAWRALPIPGAGRGDGAVLVAADQEGELRALAELIARRRPVEGELAWALERFELGCEREDALTGLSDHLLALRALLEPEGPRSGRLAGRVAALCAVPNDRVAMTERVARAISLEQSLIGGARVGPDGVALAREVEHHLRALLRDLISGHLRPELVELADSLLWEQGEPEPGGEPRVVRRPRAPTLDDDLFVLERYCASEGEAPLVG